MKKGILALTRLQINCRKFVKENNFNSLKRHIKTKKCNDKLMIFEIVTVCSLMRNINCKHKKSN